MPPQEGLLPRQQLVAAPAVRLSGPGNTCGVHRLQQRRAVGIDRRDLIDGRHEIGRRRDVGEVHRHLVVVIASARAVSAIGLHEQIEQHARPRQPLLSIVKEIRPRTCAALVSNGGSSNGPTESRYASSSMSVSRPSAAITAAIRLLASITASAGARSRGLPLSELSSVVTPSMKSATSRTIGLDMASQARPHAVVTVVTGNFNSRV